ncbi:MAG: response regulator transcription factor [Bacteroidia bacterium]
MIKVVVADDHKMFAEGITALLNTYDDIEVIGILNSGKALVEYLLSNSVDVVLCDIDMPELNGEDALKAIRVQWPSLKVIMLTSHDEPSFINQFVELGANGYVLKNTDRAELRKAVLNVYEGKEYYNAQLVHKLQKHKEDLEKKAVQELNRIKLSQREIEIVKLTAQDLSMKEISDQLHLSINTIKTHRKNIQKKLDVTGSTGITKYAVEQGWV